MAKADYLCCDTCNDKIIYAGESDYRPSALCENCRKALESRLAKREKELEEERERIAIQDQWRKELEAERDAARSMAEKMSEYACHNTECILTRGSQGRPTEDGGYETMYDGKWYRSRPVDETPKCQCGLDELFEQWQKGRKG